MTSVTSEEEKAIKQKALENPRRIIQCVLNNGKIVLAFKIAFGVVEFVVCNTEEDIQHRMMDLKDDVRFQIEELQNLNYEPIKI